MNAALQLAKATQSTEFGKIPYDVQTEVINLLKACCRIADAPRVGPAISREAARLRTEFKTLERKYYAWRKKDWRALIPRNRCGTRKSSLPYAFTQYWKSLCMTHQNSCEAAHDQLIMEWHAGRPIPGYDKIPPADPMTDIPHGWSYTNLMNVLNRVTRFEKTAARIGRNAANKYRPKVLTTRVGLEPGQYYLFDDMWQDFKCVIPGQKGARRLLSLHALDLFTANLFAAGHKPRIYNEDTSKMENLKESEMAFFVAHILCNVGYRKAGTTLVVEHGTAALGEQFESAIRDLSGGALNIDRSGITGQPIAKGMFRGQSKGNPRFKAALESLHNLIHNRTGNRMQFPGQTGGNSRLNAPEEMYGRDHYTERLLKAMDRLAPEQADQIQLPYLDYRQAIEMIDQVYDAINNRKKHKLEGWEKAGLTTMQWRLDPRADWQPQTKLLLMPPEKRAAIELLIDANPLLIEGRKMTPAEAWQQRDLVRLPRHHVARMLGEKLGKEVRIEHNHTIEFQDQAVDPDPIIFSATARDETGTRYLKPGESFLAFLNPFAAGDLDLFDSQRRYVGTVERQWATCRADTEALQQACGKAAAEEKRLLDAVIRGKAAEIAQQRDMRRNNMRAMKGDKSRRSSNADFSDLVDDQVEPEEAEPAEASDFSEFL